MQVTLVVLMVSILLVAVLGIVGALSDLWALSGTLIRAVSSGAEASNAHVKAELPVHEYEHDVRNRRFRGR